MLNQFKNYLARCCDTPEPGQAGVQALDTTRMRTDSESSSGSANQDAMPADPHALLLASLLDDASDSSDLSAAAYGPADSDTAFSLANMYDKCVQGRIEIECNGYRAFHTRLNKKEFIFFTALEIPESASGFQRTRSQGWKLHVLVDDTQDNGNLEKGWLIVKDQLTRHEIYMAKIINPDYRQMLRNDPDQCSKTITVYSFKQTLSTQQWQQFIYDTSEALSDAGIIASAKPDSDEAIRGTGYFCCRNDSNHASLNPFAGIDVSAHTRSASSKPRSRSHSS